ncbi:hypothetical protein M9Y10_022090 [Tritrichomonas musculus]|uniref:Protein kinase domain-containing protein n=1 Tax=Tritrichomonas musculus TaxID=1915356 RepID=A0ABR2KR97_9EUKA
MYFAELQSIFKDIELIYQSETSTVCYATHINTNIKVCLKMIQVSHLDETQLHYIKREIRIHRKISHPYITKFYGMLSINNNNTLVLVLEYVGKVTLLEKLNDSGGMSENEAKKIISQLSYSLFFLHVSCNIAHRDLKLENIIYDEENDVIKLLDFGVSSESNIMSTKCGSLPYCSPELILGKSYAKEVDIWSAGVISYSLLTGQLPFDDVNTQNLIHKIINSDPPPIPFSTPESRDLIKRMLEKNPNDRIKIEEILDHKWLNDSECSALSREKFFESFDFIGYSDASEHKFDPDIIKMIPDCNYETLCKQFNSKTGTPQTIHYNILYWQFKLSHLFSCQASRLGISCVASSFMSLTNEEPLINSITNHPSLSSRNMPSQQMVLSLSPQKTLPKKIPKLETKDRMISAQLGMKQKLISGQAHPQLSNCKCSSGPIFTLRIPSLNSNKKVLIKKQTPLFIPSFANHSDHNVS